jgi:hypothetical protein
MAMSKSGLVLAVGATASGQTNAERAARGRLDLLAGFAALAFVALTLAVLPRPDSVPPLTQMPALPRIARPAVAARTSIAPASEIARRHARDAYASLPLSFIPNRGQTDESVRYYAQGSGYAFYFTDKKAVLSLQKQARGEALHLRFLGGSAHATLEPGRRSHGKVNYLKGDGPKRWQTGLPTYGQLAYRGLWPGVDMSFRGAGGRLKYEFHLKPGASAERIRLAYAGAEALSVTRTGSLLIHTPLGTLRDSTPRAWQRIGGRRVPVQSRYSLNKSAGRAPAYGFEVGAYDRSYPLVIDPGLAYSTFLGGTGTDLGNGIAVDASGSAYVTGRSTSALFPTTAGAFDTTHNGGDDGFVTKLEPDGAALAYSTFVGGTGTDEGTGIALDGAGSAYITGDTTSSDFPTTAGAFDTSFNGDDAFVTKLDPSGAALAYSSFLGGTGNDYGDGIAVDAGGSAYVTGYTISGNFPTTTGAFDTTNAGFFDAFVTKLDATGSTLSYSTFLGGSDTDIGNGIAIDGAGSAYVAGSTRSSAFPTTAGAFDTSHNGIDDAFVTKLDASGSALAYSTFLGGTDTDGGGAIALDGAGSAYVTGYTASTTFPTTSGAFDTSYNSDGDAFVTKLNASGSTLAYSTYLGGTGTGGTGYDSGSGIAVDGAGSAYVTGRTDSAFFPTTAGAFDTIYNGVGDTFVTKLDMTGPTLSYATFLGATGTDVGDGIAIDSAGSAYVTGYTTSSGFPTSAGAFDTTSNGGYDAFVAKLDLIPGGYPRPRGASPLRVSLAPAYKACASPNSAHGAPLASPSCNPPVQESSYLTVGTPDANGQPVNAVDSVTFVVVNGDSSTAQNEADVRITATLTDVRKKSDLSDYTGELQLNPTLRITDKYNGPGPSTEPFSDSATTSDLSFPVTIPCATTGSTTIGSSCSVATTANAVLAGVVNESRRTIWQSDRIQVFDGGADEMASTSDNTLFETQAVFVP